MSIAELPAQTVDNDQIRVRLPTKLENYPRQFFYAKGDLVKMDISLTQMQHSLLVAYNRLLPDDLILFLRLRSLSTEGDVNDLVARLAKHDLKLYGNSPSFLQLEVTPPTCKQTPPPSLETTAKKLSPPTPSQARHNKSKSIEYNRAPGAPVRLPPELWATIMGYIDEFAWEMSTALGFPASVKHRPTEWERSATPVDYAILTGSIAEVRRVLAANNTQPKLLHNLENGHACMGSGTIKCVNDAGKFTEVGGNLMIRFGYTNLLTFFWERDREHFASILGGGVLPTKASTWNQLSVLDWWFTHSIFPSSGIPLRTSTTGPRTMARTNGTFLYRAYSEDALDFASKNAHFLVLDWWKMHIPQHHLRYTDASLEGASMRGHISVLGWWKDSGLALKLGRVVDLASGAGHVDVLSWWLQSGLQFTYKEAMSQASNNGRVNVLDWWKESGLRLLYDTQALVGATLHNKPEALEWWKRSGLPIEYRICDIEEALEDAPGGGAGARAWWMAQDVNFRASNKEWSEMRLLTSA